MLRSDSDWVPIQETIFLKKLFASNILYVRIICLHKQLGYVNIMQQIMLREIIFWIERND